MARGNDNENDIGLVVFDMAGTIVDYGCIAPAGVFVDVFTSRGIEVSLELARGPMGMQKKDHIRAMSQMPEIKEQWLKKISRECTEQDIEDMFGDFVPMQLEQLPKFSDLIPQAGEVVEKLRSMGIRIGATTGYNREMTDIVVNEMKRQGLEPDICLSADDVSFARPAPWLIFKCMEMMDVYPPQRVLKVGDTLQDVYAGKNAGAWSAAVIVHGNAVGLPKDEVEAMDSDQLEAAVSKAGELFTEAGADFILEGLWDVIDVVNEINAGLAEGKRPGAGSRMFAH